MFEKGIGAQKDSWYCTSCGWRLDWEPRPEDYMTDRHHAIDCKLRPSAIRTRQTVIDEPPRRSIDPGFGHPVKSRSVLKREAAMRGDAPPDFSETIDGIKLATAEQVAKVFVANLRDGTFATDEAAAHALEGLLLASYPKPTPTGKQ